MSYFVILFLYRYFIYIVASPGQKQGTCSHLMSSFDFHLKCADCHEPGPWQGYWREPLLKKDCDCNSLSTEQKTQLSTPSYKTGKDKKMATPQIINPETVHVLDAVDATSSAKKLASEKRKGTAMEDYSKKKSV